MSLAGSHSSNEHSSKHPSRPSPSPNHPLEINRSSSTHSHLKPGYGWIEYVDIDLQARCEDGTLTPSHALSQWQNYLLESTERSGKPLRYDSRTGLLLKEAGFVDIQEIVHKLPLSPWHSDPYLKDCGRWYNLGLSEGLEAFTLGPMTRVMGWSAEEVNNLLVPVQKDINSKQIHAYHNMYVHPSP